jgi:LSD1 subclass zinc finger protein
MRSASPGAISGEAEVDCPHCGSTLTVVVDDPMGSQTYRCSHCQTVFKVNWGQ